MSKRLMVFPAFIITIILAGSATISAQQQPPQQPGPDQQMQRRPQPPDDPLADAMFPPDLIMQHQRELGLTDEQKSFMRGEIQRTTTRFNELEWQLQDAMEALHETMKGSQVNEQQALAQLSKVLDAEREIKTLHMAMAIRIKNKLTPDQQMKLQMMRNTMGPPREPRRAPGGPDRPDRGPDRPDGPMPGGPGGGGPRPGGRPGGPPQF